LPSITDVKELRGGEVQILGYVPERLEMMWSALE
jgi:hypothetical protein